MTRLLIVRHGETDWNREGRWQGHAGPGLNELGRRQAAAIATRLVHESPQVLVSSDLARATETAAAIGEVTGLAARLEPRFREVDVGEWSSLTRAEVAERYPSEFRQWEQGTNRGYPGGETFEQLQARCLAALDDLFEQDGGRTIALVAHGGSIRALIGSVLGLDAARRRLLATGRNCSLSVIESRHSDRRVVAVNDDGHLIPELTGMI
jgi:glucosyl-3-phosphoglycerate phosphatase